MAVLSGLMQRSITHLVRTNSLTANVKSDCFVLFIDMISETMSQSKNQRQRLITAALAYKLFAFTLSLLNTQSQDDSPAVSLQQRTFLVSFM